MASSFSSTISFMALSCRCVTIRKRHADRHRVRVERAVAPLRPRSNSQNESNENGSQATLQHASSCVSHVTCKEFARVTRLFASSHDSRMTSMVISSCHVLVISVQIKLLSARCFAHAFSRRRTTSSDSIPNRRRAGSIARTEMTGGAAVRPAASVQRRPSGIADCDHRSITVFWATPEGQLFVLRPLEVTGPELVVRVTALGGRL